MPRQASGTHAAAAEPASVIAVPEARITDLPEPPGAASSDDVGQRVVRGGVARASGFIVSNLLAAAGAVVILRYLGVTEFGRYGTVMALAAIVQGITDAGLSVTGTRELSLAGSAADRRRVLAHLVGLRIILTGIGVPAAVAFSALVGYDSTLVKGTALAGAAVFLMSVQSAMLIPLSVDLRNVALTVNEVLRQGILIVGFVLLALAGAGLLAFFAVQIAAGLVLMAIVPLLLERHDRVRPRWTLQEMRSLAAVGLPVALAAVVTAAYVRVLVVVMSLRSDDPEQIGLFVTSTRVFELVAALPVMLSIIVLPVVSVAARDDRARLRYVVQQMTQAMAVGGTLVTITIALAAEPILRILGGPEYVDAAPVLRIQSIALLTLFITAAWTPTLIGMHRQGSVAAATAIGLLIAITAGVALVPGAQAEGAAWAAATADAFVLLAVYVLLRRAGPGRDLRLDFVPRLLVAAALALATALVPGIPALVDAVMGAAIFAVAVLALRIVPPEIAGLLPARGRVVSR
jgi:O-antigen/teichoic acid export membrane protein